ncbi:ATP synthase subunit I [Neisseria perflava]|uniref:ATP synthase subunit I n=1 Tax=Neisseria perflava TaxID=33053 RepID=UPI00209CAEB4|nr:ATP synthase subunit I [Neisseria perflava]MCP1661098.1 ATP synthase protein I [Neisseria perflava]
MKRIVPLQLIVLAVISVVSAWVWGVKGFWSALAGGASYLVPTLVAVLLLKFFRQNPVLQSRMFVFGEALKVMLSLIMMLAVFAAWHQSLVFFPFLLGLAGVSHLVFLVLLRVRDYGR